MTNRTRVQAKFAAALDKVIAQGAQSECVWNEDGEDGPWATGCGHYFAITDGTPSDNDMRYCCFCGRPLRESPHEDEDDDLHDVPEGS